MISIIIRVVSKYYQTIGFGIGYAWIDRDRFFFIDLGAISIEIGGKRND